MANRKESFRTMTEYWNRHLENSDTDVKPVARPRKLGPHDLTKELSRHHPTFLALTMHEWTPFDKSIFGTSTRDAWSLSYRAKHRTNRRMSHLINIEPDGNYNACMSAHLIFLPRSIQLSCRQSSYTTLLSRCLSVNPSPVAKRSGRV